MLEITNSLSHGKEGNVPTRPKSHKSVMGPVKVGVDYRGLQHRKIPSVRPRTSPLVRPQTSEKKEKNKLKGNLEINGTASLLHEESIHRAGSIFSEKSNTGIRNKLLYMCHDIEGSSILNENPSYPMVGESGFENSVLEEVEQRQPFTESEPEVQEKGDIEEPIQNMQEELRPISPNDPNRFFFDLWLTKHSPELLNESNDSKVKTFHVELMCRLQNAYAKAKYLNSLNSKDQRNSNQEDYKNEDNSVNSDVCKLSQNQIGCLKLIGLTALDIIDSIIREKGEEYIELTAIKDALLPLIFDSISLNLENVPRENVDDAEGYGNHTTFLEKYFTLEDQHSTLTSKYETMMKNYLSLEIQNSDLTKSNHKLETKLGKSVEKCNQVSLKLQEVSNHLETSILSLTDAEQKLGKNNELISELQSKCQALETTVAELKSENTYLVKESKEFESKTLFLLKEQDKLIKENDLLTKVKFENKKSLSELENTYSSLLSSFNTMYEVYHQKYENGAFPSLQQLIYEDEWLEKISFELSDKQANKISYEDLSVAQSRRSTFIVGKQSIAPIEEDSQLPSISEGSATSDPEKKTEKKLEKKDAKPRKSMINPRIAKSKSIAKIFNAMDDKILNETEKISKFSDELANGADQLDNLLNSLQRKKFEILQIQEQYERKIDLLYQERSKLLSDHQEHVINLQNEFRKDLKSVELSQKEIIDNLRKQMMKKDFEVVTMKTIRDNQIKQITNLNEELQQKTLINDILTHQKSLYYDQLQMVQNDSFWFHLEERRNNEIMLKSKQLLELSKSFQELTKDFNLQVKETNRIRETSDRQIYVLLKEKDKFLNDKTMLESEIALLKETNSKITDEILKITEEKLEINAKLMIFEQRFEFREDKATMVEAAGYNSMEIQTDPVKFSPIESETLEEKTPENAIQHNENSEKISGKKKSKKKRKSSKTRRRSTRKSLGSIQEEDNSEDELSDMSSSSDSSESDSDASSSGDDEELPKSRKQKKISSRSESISSTLSGVVTDPKKFTEERRKSLLKESIRNSILFDKHYSSVETTVNIFNNAAALELFVERIKEENRKFSQLKKEFVSERMAIQREFEKYNDLFFSQSESILKVLKKKITVMHHVTVAEVLSQELQKVINQEDLSANQLTPEFGTQSPDDCVDFTEIPTHSLTRKSSEVNSGHKASFVNWKSESGNLSQALMERSRSLRPDDSTIFQTKSDEQVNKLLDLKAILRISRKLSAFAMKKKRKVSGNENGSQVNDSESSDEGGEEIDEDSLKLDGFESVDTISELKKERRKRKTLKPKILIEIDPSAQEKISSKNALRQHSHDRFYNVGTQTEDSFSYSVKLPSEGVVGRKRSAVISNSFLIKNVASPPLSHKGKLIDLSDPDSRIDEDSESVDTKSNSSKQSTFSSRLKSDTIFSELLNKYYSKDQISQPFLGFVRKHEKIYAREIGLMKIALREFKRFYEHLLTEIQHLLYLNSSNATTSTILSHVLNSMRSGEWMFDPSLFVRKANNNPFEDCIDAATQIRIIESYQELLTKRLLMNTENRSLTRVNTDLHNKQKNELQAITRKILHDQKEDESVSEAKVNSRPRAADKSITAQDSQLFHDSVEANPTTPERKSRVDILKDHRASLIQDLSPDSNDKRLKETQKQEALYQIINHTIKDLLVDLNNRLRRSGGWKSLLYRSDGTVDVDLDPKHFSLEEQILIQTEKVNYLTFKCKQKNENYEVIIGKLQKQNHELSNKIQLLQKQLQNHQHVNYNNNLDKLNYYRGDKAETAKHVHSSSCKDIGTNTEISTAKMKEIDENDWNKLNFLLRHIDSKVQELLSDKNSSRFVSRERFEELQLQFQRFQESHKSHLEKVQTLKKKDVKPSDTELDRMSMNDSLSQHIFKHEEIDGQLQYQSDEEFSKYSTEIIDAYRSLTDAEENPNTQQSIVLKSNKPAAQRPFSASPLTQFKREPAEISRKAQPLKPLGFISTKEHDSLSSTTEYVSITGPKALNVKAKQRPWSSSTWKQAEKGAKDIFSEVPKQRNSNITVFQPVQPSSEQLPAENGNSETADMFHHLIRISERLEKAFFAIPNSKQIEPIENTLVKSIDDDMISRTSESKSIHLLLTSPVPPSNVVERRGPYNGKEISQASQDLDLHSNVLDTISAVQTTAPAISIVDTSVIEDPEKSVALGDHLNEDVIVIGVGESAIEEHQTAESPKQLADSASYPPELESFIFSPPAFPESSNFLAFEGKSGKAKGQNQSDGIYSTLYEQMFSILDQNHDTTHKKSPKPQNQMTLPFNLESIREKLDHSKSTISSDMALYLSSVHTKYLEAKEQSEKLFVILSNFAKSYSGVELPKNQFPSLNFGTEGESATKLSSSDIQQKIDRLFLNPVKVHHHFN